jgi:DNA-binding transcriptional regulator YiaG
VTCQEFRKARKSLGYTQQALATAMGKSLPAVQTWEYGSREVPKLVEYFLETELEKGGHRAEVR